MVVMAEASARVSCSAREVLEFVLDLERYREADTKIGRVSRPVELDEGHRGTARYWGRLRGLPPAPDTNIVELEPWTSVCFRGAPRQPGRLVMDFEGTFTCAEDDDGCTVTHRYEIRFRRLFQLIYEPFLGDWLQDELVDEMERLARILDGRSSAPAT